MACYSFNLKIISRGKRNSIVGAAAYNNGERLSDHYYGGVHDYTNRDDVICKGILLPDKAPERLYDLQTLITELDAAERRKDSQMARSYKLALPNELPPEEWQSMVIKFCVLNFTSKGYCANYAIHEGRYNPSKKAKEIPPVFERKNNPHVHLIVPIRKLDESGFLKIKNDNHFHSRSEVLVALRECWADIQNDAFARYGLDVRVSHKSLEDQGINRKPTIHMGEKAMAREIDGDPTPRGDRYLKTLAEVLPPSKARKVRLTLSQRAAREPKSKVRTRSSKERTVRTDTHPLTRPLLEQDFERDREL